MSDFDRAFDLVIGAEGGFVDDSRDPGGATKYGITARDHPGIDIESLTLDQAKQIYLVEYWTPSHCDQMSWPINAMVFDAAVNQGQGAAIKCLQGALGVPQDGVFGDHTKAALTTHDATETAALFMAARAQRYFTTVNFDRFGRGWLKRLFKLSMEVFNNHV